MHYFLTIVEERSLTRAAERLYISQPALSKYLGRLENELREISGVILRTSMEGCELFRRGAPLSEINTALDFMRTLFGRREMIIHEIKRVGGSERDAVRRLREDGA